MKTISFIILILIFLNSANAACDSSNCGDCTLYADCVGVASDACVWNVKDNDCQVTMVGTVLTGDCNIYDEQAHACTNEVDCGFYNYSTNTCHNSKTGGNGDTDCSQLNNYKALCLAQTMGGNDSGCNYDDSTNSCTENSPLRACSSAGFHSGSCLDVEVGENSDEGKTGCGWTLDDECIPIPEFTQCSDLNQMQGICDEHPDCTHDGVSQCILTADLIWGGPRSISTCASFNNMRQICNGIDAPDGDNSLGCAYNESNDNCVAIATFSSVCSEFDGMQKACEADTDNCGFFLDTLRTCHNVNSTGGDGSSNCEQLGSFKTQCEAQSNTAGTNSTGCIFNGLQQCVNNPIRVACVTRTDWWPCVSVYANQNSDPGNLGCEWNPQRQCVPIPVFTGCSVYSGLPDLCKNNKTCVNNHDETICKEINKLVWGGPDSVSTCSALDEFEDACNAIGAPNGDNGYGCTYNLTDNGCDAIQNFIGCSDFSGFPSACEAETASCGTYNYETHVCNQSVKPTYTDTNNCDTMDGFKDLCDAINAGVGKGEHDRGCSFSWIDGTCTSTPAYSSGVESCSVFNGLEASCLAAGSSDCVYSRDTNNCTSKCAEKSASDGNCGECAVESHCNDPSANGCSWNSTDNQCDATPNYDDDCSILTKFQYACTQQSGCLYNNNICKPEPTTCADADNSSCQLCDDDKMACDAISGCSFNSSSTPAQAGCKVTPSYSACTDYNYFEQACKDDGQNCGTYNNQTGVCSSEAPAVSSGCNDLNGYEAGCNAIAPGNSNASNGCVYTSFAGAGLTLGNCVERPNKENCQSFSNFKYLCVQDDDCTYVESSGVCKEIQCSDLNMMANKCEANSDCGHYNYGSDECNDKNAIPSYSDNCEVLDGWKLACEIQSECNYDADSNKCTKKQIQNEIKKEDERENEYSNNRVSKLYLSLISSIILVLLL